jgi:hypothetical protein
MSYTPEHLSLWSLPSCYVGAHWEGWFVFLGRSRDSDDLTESNFETAWAELQKLPAVEVADDGEEMNGLQQVRENHWAVGWVEWIAIHQTNEAALRAADEMAGRLESYPVLDEDDWSRREDESAQRIWRDCYDAKDRVAYIREHRRQFEFASFSDLLGCVRGKYFAGYPSELIQ